MADIGWTSEAAYDTFLSTRAGFEGNSWTDPQKTAALTTAYNRLRFSSLFSIPSSPSADQLEILAYAQSEYAINFNLEGLPEGEKRRLSIIGNGVTKADIVKEEYDKNKSNANESKIPSEIVDLLEDFSTEQPVRTSELFRNEDDNETFDNNMPEDYS